MIGHTAGPWSVGPNCRTVRPDPFSGMPNGVFIICELPEHARDNPGNARVIAAAPELLAVVKELQESASYWSEYDVPLGIVDRINAAIEKATGAAA